MPVHGTRGTTGSEGCLLVYSVVGKSLIFPVRPFALLPKFEAGKPGGETGRDAGFTASLPEFSGRRKTKGRHASEIHGKQVVAGSAPGPAAGRRRGAALTLLRFRKAGVLPRPAAPGPGGAWRRRLRARREPAPLLLEARPGLPALPAAPGGVQGGQALLLQAPPAGRSKRPCRASGGLLVRPAAQQLLGKVGLLRAAAAARAACGVCVGHRPTWSCNRMRWPICALCPARRPGNLCRPSLHLPRPKHELLSTTWPCTRSSETHSSRAVRRAGGPRAIQQGRLPRKPEQARTVPSAQRRIDGGNPLASAGLMGANPVPSAGLMARRVNGENQNSLSDAVLAASLTVALGPH